MRQLALRYPKGEIHIVWDNLNIHYDGPDKRWTRFNQRHGNRFHFHYTPLHASWVNQVELFFARLQKRVLRYASFRSISELGAEVMAEHSVLDPHRAGPSSPRRVPTSREARRCRLLRRPRWNRPVSCTQTT